MLESKSMRVLHEALRPPEGFALDYAVGTTFTIDLVSLLSIPLAVGNFTDSDGGPSESNPLELLASLERSADRIVVFHQAGEIRLPGRHRELLTLVEHSLCAVKLQPGRLFHPKVWVLRYREPRGSLYHRVAVLSRNLTSDQSRDTVLVLEGEMSRSVVQESRPLCDLLAWLSKRPALTGERKAAVSDVAKTLTRVRFRPPVAFKSVTFRPLGIPHYAAHPVASNRRDRVLVVSPFVGDSELQRLSTGASENILVTRAEELARLADPKATGFSRIFQLDDGLEPEPSDEETADPAILSGFHAKLYVADQGWNATVWTGSPNATTAGFGANVELLVELGGKKGVCGVKAILGEEEPEGFFSMLDEVYLDHLPDPAQDDKVERRLDELAGLVAALPIEALCERSGSGWRLDLFLDGASLPDGVSVHVAPLASTVAERPLDPSRSPVVSFDGLANHEVSGLFAVQIQLDAPRAARRFVALWALTSEDQPDRVQALLARLVTDREKLIAFLRLMLGGGGLHESLGPGGVENGSRNGWGFALASGLPPFELLVRALADNPERLDSLARWITDLAAAADDQTANDLLAIWQPIWEARLGMQT